MIINIPTEGGTVALEIAGATFTATPPAPTPPPPAPAPPPPPPPPPPAARKALHQWHKLGQPLGSPTDAVPWSAHSLIRTPVAFSAVQVLFANPGSAVGRIIPAHMVGTGPSGGLSPAAWHAAQGAVSMPVGTAQRNAYAMGGVIECAPVAASDGGASWLHLRADMYGAVWNIAPDGYSANDWDAAYPATPFQSWVRYGSHAATPATAGNGSGWIDKPGTHSVGGVVLHHATPHVALLDIGDSTTDGDLILPGVCNYQGAGWRAAELLRRQGVRVTYGRLSQGGAQWDDMQYQLQAAIAAGVCGPGCIVFLQTFTSNQTMTADQHWSRRLTLVSMAQAAGATPVLVGPMCSTNHSDVRNQVRAMMMGSGLPYVDVGAAIGTQADPSIFAPGMCGDPTGLAVHPSPAANALMAQQRVVAVQQILG